MAKGLISTGSSRRLVGSVGEYFESEEEAKVAFGAAHRRGAAEGVTPAVHGETGLDQGALDCLVVNSLAGVILCQVAGAYHGSAVGGVAGCAEFANAAGEAGKKIGAVVKQVGGGGGERKEAGGGKFGGGRGGVQSRIEENLG